MDKIWCFILMFLILGFLAAFLIPSNAEYLKVFPAWFFGISVGLCLSLYFKKEGNKPKGDKAA
jgi:hypothetical protein